MSTCAENMRTMYEEAVRGEKSGEIEMAEELIYAAYFLFGDERAREEYDKYLADDLDLRPYIEIIVTSEWPSK